MNKLYKMIMTFLNKLNKILLAFFIRLYEMTFAFGKFINLTAESKGDFRYWKDMFKIKVKMYQEDPDTRLFKKVITFIIFYIITPIKKYIIEPYNKYIIEPYNKYIIDPYEEYILYPWYRIKYNGEIGLFFDKVKEYIISPVRKPYEKYIQPIYFNYYKYPIKEPYIDPLMKIFKDYYEEKRLWFYNWFYYYPFYLGPYQLNLLYLDYFGPLQMPFTDILPLYLEFIYDYEMILIWRILWKWKIYDIL